VPGPGPNEKRFAVRFPRRVSTGLGYVVEYSDEPAAGWSRGLGQSVTEHVEDRGDGTQTVTVRPLVPFDFRGFARLSIVSYTE
jgi:hypothetical protein